MAKKASTGKPGHVQPPAGAKHRIVKDLLPLAVAVGDITPDPDNPYDHPAEQIELLGESLERHGQRQAFVAQRSAESGAIILRDGHARLEAAKSLGWTHVAVVIQELETDSEATSYQIAANEAVRGRKRNDPKFAKVVSKMTAVDRAFTTMKPGELDKLIKKDAREVVGDDKPKGKTKITAEIICPHCGESFKR